MATYTVRPTESEENDVEILKEHLNEKASTKALLKAAELVPKQAREIEELKRQRQKLSDMLAAYQVAGNNINAALETFRANDEVLEQSTCKLYTFDDEYFVLR